MKPEKVNAQLYFDSADVFMVAIGSDGKVTDINRKGCEILGYNKNEVISKYWFDTFLPKESAKNAKRVFRDMIKGTQRHVHYEHSIVTKRGEERVFNWHNVLAVDKMGNVVGSLSSGSDITEQRIAEKTMPASAADRLKNTLDTMQEGCQIIDYDFRYVYVNDTAAKQGRQTRQELLGRTMMELYSGIEKTKMFERLSKVMKTRVPDQMENEFVFPDGSKAWFDLRIEPAPEGALILSIDISRHKQLEKELDKYRERLEQVVGERTAEFAKANQELTREVDEHRRTEEKLLLRATILDNAGAGIFLLNKNGDFVYANEEAARIYGYSRDEFLGMNLSQLLPPEDAHLIEPRLKEIFEKGQLWLEAIHLRKDRSPMMVQIRHTLINTKHGTFIVSVMRTDNAKETEKKVTG